MSPDNSTKTLSAQEFCQNESDVVRSKTAMRILEAVTKFINTGKQWLEGLNTDGIVALYQKVFVDRFPITVRERDYLVEFFSKESVTVLWQSVFSQLSIQQSDENKAFMRGFLENDEGKYDSAKFIGYVLEELRRYPLAMDINTDSIDKGEYMDGAGQLYFYIDNVSEKHKVFLVRKNEEESEEIVTCEDGFIKRPNNIGSKDRGILVGIKSTNESPNSADRATEKIGAFYWFNPETNKLEEFYAKKWLESASWYGYGLYITGNETGSGMIGISKGEDGQWEVSEILADLYNHIGFLKWAQGHVVTYINSPRNTVLQIHKLNTVPRNIPSTIEQTHAWSLEEIKKSERYTCTQLYEQETAHNTTDGVSFLKDLGIYQIKLPNEDDLGYWTYNYCKVDEDGSTIIPIEWLQWVGDCVNRWIQSNIDDFFEWKPLTMKEKSGASIKMWDKQTGTAKTLIKLPGSPYKLFREWNRVRVDIVGWDTSYFVFHEWKMYGMKKWFIVKDWEIYKGWRYLAWRLHDISLESSFDSINQYLEEVETPVIFN